MEKQKKDPNDIIAGFIVEGTCKAVVERYHSLAEYASQTHFGALDEDVVVIDTETTGFSLSHDELLQIAAARMKNGKITEWYVTFVNPGCEIPEEIVHLTGITADDVTDAPAPNEAIEGLVSFVGDSDLVAHNANFDYNFVTKHPKGYPLSQNTWLDSLDLARIALPRLKSHRLLDLVKAFGAPISTHRADEDVAALCAVYRIFLAAVAKMPASLVEKIAGLTSEEEWATAKIFRVISELQAADPTTENLPFSLKSLRFARVGEIPFKAKVDADAIASDPLRHLEFPGEAEIEQAFSPEGLVGQLYDNYETRDEQVKMAKHIRRAFSSSVNLAIEAGTGVGKSMAYLVPAVLSARKNNITVGVATKTNALLDQLMFKELPLIYKGLEENEPVSENAKVPLNYVALKGFGHYICLRQVNRILEDEVKNRMIAGKLVFQAPSIATLLSFIEQSEYDDIDSLKMDYRVLPRYQITTTSHECLRRKCPFYCDRCFVHGVRRRAEGADIVVTNHSLLFCDLAADGGLLPSIRYWVVDEAHGTEDEARRAFSLTIAADEVQRLARKVAADEAAHNVFIRAERRAGAELDNATLFYTLTTKARAAGKAFEEAANEFLHHIKDLSFFDTNKRSKGYDYVELWLNDDIRNSETFRTMVSFGRRLCDKIEELITASQEVVAILESVEEAAEVQREIATIGLNLKELLHAAEIILFKAPHTYAYSATFSRKNDKISEKLEALLINVGEKLNETLFTNTHSVIFTSATLAVADGFGSFETALGLNESEFSTTATFQLDSSYDFDNNMRIYVVDDMPDPNDSAYLFALQDLLTKVHLAQKGSFLTLFTNRREMEKCFECVQPQLKEEELRVVCQKWGISAKGLRDDFLTDEHLSLFALKSFWEGFDAPGSTLKGVIIPKLPFAKPSDPLSCERAQRDPQAWLHYVLPAAVLETKQAAGRLIRKADDKGCLILADRRLLTKGYGKTFLESMPSKNIKICSSAIIAQELEEYYNTFQ